MRNLFVLLVISALIFSCEKDGMVYDNYQQVEVRNIPNKIGACHYDMHSKSWSLIEITTSEMKAHVAHGDVFDMDGDGYFAAENKCGQPVDCNDHLISVKNCGFCGYLNQMKFGENSMYCDWNVRMMEDYPYAQAFDTWICSNFKSNSYRYIYLYVRQEADMLIAGFEVFDMGEKLMIAGNLSAHDALACRKILQDYAKMLGLNNDCSDQKTANKLPVSDNCFEPVIEDW